MLLLKKTALRAAEDSPYHNIVPASFQEKAEDVQAAKMVFSFRRKCAKNKITNAGRGTGRTRRKTE
jgi:hypothetical protein